MLVDVHCHLDDPRFKDDLDKVIERAKNAGVKAIISNGTTPKSNMRVLELSKKYDIIKPAFGMYPISALNKKSLSGEAPEFYEFDADECAEMIRKRRKEIIAIGEVGM
ncbi:MAG TPA: TatD family hydrolase, partial [Candidatus Nanoarchaeia archaeon]|nr:TatD family hydrolase [Candidatus Nanoarchaeia archaeon]